MGSIHSLGAETRILSITLLVWSSFIVFIVFVVALDLGVFHRRPHVISLREALVWTLVWIALALIFNVCIYFLYEYNPAGWDIDTAQLSGREAALQYLVGYIVEKSLSIDNIFVIAMVFSSLAVPREQQHRVLFWGIFGAVILRGVMILFGAVLIAKFDWVVYVFGAILLLSAARMLTLRQDTINPEEHFAIRLVRRFYPVTSGFRGKHFFVVEDGVKKVTPLFLALLLVEVSDVTFAVDSIPAIFAVTRDPFIVFTSNIFAILGLRSLFFVLDGMMERFRYLKPSLVFLLAYIGVKMMLQHHYPIPNVISLAVISGILFVGVLASLRAPKVPGHD
jgi:tellurite resistance protein TerC